MMLRSTNSIRPLYLLPTDPLAKEVLIPGFQAADSVDCMVGFFSGSVLASLAPGLATYIARDNNPFRLVVSPLLRREDMQAIEAGLRSPEEVAIEALEELVITEESLQKHTLKCLSWLLRTGRIEIRVALMKDALFHPKVWLFTDEDAVMAVHGSSNVTYAGITKNIEQVAVSKSWEDPNQRYIVQKLRDRFRELWEGTTDNCVIIQMPQALQEKLIRTYATNLTPPTEADLQALYERAKWLVSEADAPGVILAPDRIVFSLPPGLRFGEGPFAHQSEAVAAWCRAEHRGVLEMATGSGKTITAMVCAYRLHETSSPLLIVVAAPYLPLVQQWCDEIRPFGLRPLDLTLISGTRGRATELNRARRRLQNGSSSVEIVVVTHRTLCSDAFKAELQKFNCASLLIADEVHNLGAEGFTSSPPLFFNYRLGLSATPMRQYDEQGTDALFSFFGPVVFRFTLQEAIGRCLVPYNYYIHPVQLTPEEMDDWSHLTAQIRAAAWRSDLGEPDDYVAKLLRNRRAILETAKNKIAELDNCLRNEVPQALRYALIYATDKAPDQLLAVNALLLNHRVLFHQLTYEETADRNQTDRIIKSFQEGTIQVLTAKRVLDEGVNIPQVERAFILASTTVERQWVQRRGRLLRVCPETGKTHSDIHDFVALPHDLETDDPDAKMLIQSELLRVQEFARLAQNAGQPDGPLPIIHELVKAAFM